MNRQIKVLKLLDQLHDLPIHQHAAFLAEACADDVQLRKEIESMLAMRASAESFDAEAGGLNPTEFPATKSEAGAASDLRLNPSQLLLDRYEIQSTLGHGGMGEVYRASDLRLDREVAIKVLNAAALGVEQMHDRFDRELKSVAKLSHINIVTLYDVAADGDILFAVMELIDGRTLRHLVRKQMQVDDAMKIARDIAAGLTAAHRSNIMHRDIKPENIMVTSEGVAKILDFGIAKSETHDDQITATSAVGMIPGTPPYMSPEQAEGGEVGCPTDVFSLGTVFFEMLTGTNPFRGQSLMQTLNRICESSRPRVAQYRGDVPKPLRDLLDSMIQVKAAERPTAGEVQSSLNDLAGSTNTPPIVFTRSETPMQPSADGQPDSTVVSATGGRPSIAVLPLAPIDKDKQAKMFGEAISHEVIVELSKLHSLMVIARGSSFQFRADPVDLAEIARVLDVKYVLSGTIDVHRPSCVVNVELARTRDNSILWAENFNTAIDDVLQLKHEITSQIASAIEIQVQLAEAQHAMRLPTENLDAWSAYHRGLWHMYRFNARDNQIAANLFHQSIDLDRSFAKAHAGLSFTHFQQAFLRYSEKLDEEQRLARAAAETALQLDPQDPFIHLTMGRTDWLSGDIERAGGWFEQSLQLSPSYAFATYNQGLVDAMLNAGQRSEHFIKRALTLSPIDPLNYAMHCTRAFSHLVRGQYDAAVQCTERAIRVPTAHVHIYLSAAMANELAGNGDAARELIRRVRQMDPNYTQADFLRMFPFRDSDTVRTIRTSLSRLQI